VRAHVVFMWTVIKRENKLDVDYFFLISDHVHLSCHVSGAEGAQKGKYYIQYFAIHWKTKKAAIRTGTKKAPLEKSGF